MTSLRSPQISKLWPAQLLAHAHHTISSRKISSSRIRSSRISTSVCAAASAALMTCRRCRDRFTEAGNSSSSCRFHPALFTGGEVAKAIGFVRASDAPEHQLEQVVGRKGLMRFWDCCGSEDEAAPGCCSGFHVSFDDALNEARGWK